MSADTRDTRSLTGFFGVRRLYQAYSDGGCYAQSLLFFLGEPCYDDADNDIRVRPRKEYGRKNVSHGE